MSDAPVPTRSARRRADLPSLTALRAFAAFGVLLYHLNRWQVTHVEAFGLGYAGVAFFFVLSGFILTWSHVPEQRTRDFYVRRFARVYPSHLLIWIVLVLGPIAASPPRPGPAVANLFLLQAWDPPEAFELNGVTWSLSCEVFFYAMFPLLLVGISRARLRTSIAIAVGLAALVGAVLIATVSAGASREVLTAFYTVPLLRLPEFVMGMVAARVLIRCRRIPIWLILPAGAFATTGLIWRRTWPLADLWLLPFIVVVVLAVASADLQRRTTLLRARPLMVAGRVSFAFYLVHELVVLNAARILGDGWGTAIAASVLAIAVAVVLHRLVEVPANRWLVSRATARGAARGPLAPRSS